MWSNKCKHHVRNRVPLSHIHFINAADMFECFFFFWDFVECLNDARRNSFLSHVMNINCGEIQFVKENWCVFCFWRIVAVFFRFLCEVQNCMKKKYVEKKTNNKYVEYSISYKIEWNPIKSVKNRNIEKRMKDHAFEWILNIQINRSFQPRFTVEVGQQRKMFRISKKKWKFSVKSIEFSKKCHLFEFEQWNKTVKWKENQ